MRELARSIYRRFWVLPRVHRVYKTLSIAETFSNIYATKAWGDGSGLGSIGPAAEEYCQDVIAFIRKHNIRSVADLGCGDFQVGRKIVLATQVKYVGVDIVPALINKHAVRFGNDRVEFCCANLATDPLPAAELCLVRQVLQHLSNDEIESVLKNISGYPLALISEHVPIRPKSFNRDKPHGPDVRAYWGSGVYVDKPPFSRTIELSWESRLEPDSVLRTVVLRGGEHQASS